MTDSLVAPGPTPSASHSQEWREPDRGPVSTIAGHDGGRLGPDSGDDGSGAHGSPGVSAASFSPQSWGTPGRLYLTSELRAATGLPRTHMDFYLREGIVRPTARTESGYLLFDEAELATLRAVLRWRNDGVGIKEIRARLGR